MSYTSPVRHTAVATSKIGPGTRQTSIFVENNNLLPSNAAAIAWQALSEQGGPLYSSKFDDDKYTSISNQSDYGLWYAGTQPAKFIVDKPGKAIT